MSIEEEFFWALGPAVSRSLRALGDNSVHIGTDVGLRRSENQDRVGMVRWKTADRPGSPGESLCAIAVCDGMGGMIEGGTCASIAIASFFGHLVRSRESDLQQKARYAAAGASDDVYAQYRGRGGSTLSAIVISQYGNAAGVNVGDSRIYGIREYENGQQLIRLTKDDTLNDHFGSEGKDLIQFIGIGPGLSPHTFELQSFPKDILISTDGAHYVASEVFEQVMVRAPDGKARTERAIALARWLGGHDNITVATIDVPRVIDFLRKDAQTVNLWGVTSDSNFVFLDFKREVEAAVSSAAGQNLAISPTVDPPVKSKRNTKRRSASATKKPEQLVIDIELSNQGKTEPDADSQ